jgi:hypothetical protein
MDIHIKMAREQYQRLRSGFPANSPLRHLIDNASRIDHAVEGVLFAGYDIACNEDQARAFLETAKQCCPEVIPDIEKAIKFARSVATDRAR